MRAADDQLLIEQFRQHRSSFDGIVGIEKKTGSRVSLLVDSIQIERKMCDTEET